MKKQDTEPRSGDAEHAVVIIGAGIAGLAAARRLTAQGVSVLALDKGRGVGGRCATRRFAGGRYDHGAQFFTVREAEFGEAVAGWKAAGVVSEWCRGFPAVGESEGGDGHPRYRVRGGMSGLAKAMAAGVDVRTNTVVERVAADGAGWRVDAADGPPLCAAGLIVTAPMPQALALLPAPMVEALHARYPTLAHVAYEPCFAVLARLAGPSNIATPGAVRVDGADIAWIADNSVKGTDRGAGAVTIHSSRAFAEAHMDAPKETVADALITAAQPYLGSAVTDRQVHRWRYSKPMSFVGESCMTLGAPPNLALAGDCMLPPSRIEGAYLSGLAAADALLGR